MRLMRVPGILSMLLFITGCVTTLLAQNYYTTDELVECNALVQAITQAHRLPSSQVFAGPAIGCGHEHYGLLATRYAAITIWWISEAERQEAILSTLREERRARKESHPMLVRFYDRENWMLYRDVNGQIYGEGRGPERLLRRVRLE
jgi:hypothetical protein